MLRTIVFSAFLILLVSQSNSRACCASILDWELKDTAFINGEDPSIAFTIIKYKGPSVAEQFKDTIHQSEILADLKQSYESSATVAIASISHVSEFVVAPETTGDYSYAESVSVKIEKVIKGIIPEKEKNFISPIIGRSFVKAYDSATGEVISIAIISSIADPGYKAIEGRRFLLFLSENDGNTNNLAIPKPQPCFSQLSRYMVDNEDRVYYDGLKIDSMTNSIKRISLLKSDLNKVVQAFSSTAPVKWNKTAIKQVKNSKYQMYCDLMGKRVNTNFSNVSKNASRLVLTKDQKGSKRVIMKK